MREIKFMAWDEDKKRILVCKNVDLLIDFEGRVNSHDLGILNGYDNTPQYPLMQFTNVHDDEEDNEIYSGHIVELEYEGELINCDVRAEGPGFMFVSDKIPDGYIWMSELMESDRDHFWIRNCKIIGNIYENPELLTDGSAQ